MDRNKMNKLIIGVCLMFSLKLFSNPIREEEFKLGEDIYLNTREIEKLDYTYEPYGGPKAFAKKIAVPLIMELRKAILEGNRDKIRSFHSEKGFISDAIKNYKHHGIIINSKEEFLKRWIEDEEQNKEKIDDTGYFNMRKFRYLKQEINADRMKLRFVIHLGGEGGSRDQISFIVAFLNDKDEFEGARPFYPDGKDWKIHCAWKDVDRVDTFYKRMKGVWE